MGIASAGAGVKTTKSPPRPAMPRRLASRAGMSFTMDLPEVMDGLQERVF